MVQLCDLRDAHAPDLQFQGFDPRPVIVLGGKEYMADLQEMAVWTILNWRIVRKEEIGALYEEMTGKAGVPTDRSWDACVERLLVRGLLISGSGDTEYDALYDLISSLYIIPTDSSLPLRLAAFFKLLFFNRVPFPAAAKLFRKDRRTPGEKEVMQVSFPFASVRHTFLYRRKGGWETELQIPVTHS